MTVTLADVEAARRTLKDAVLRTPMLPAPKLSEITSAEVFVKYENLQVTNSFKDRGAYVKLRRSPIIRGGSAFRQPS
jgi:threonine dehydratase